MGQSNIGRELNIYIYILLRELNPMEITLGPAAARVTKTNPAKILWGWGGWALRGAGWGETKRNCKSSVRKQFHLQRAHQNVHCLCFQFGFPEIVGLQANNRTSFRLKLSID